MENKILQGQKLNSQHKLTPGDHLVHFFESPEALSESLCNFVVPGITRGEGIVLIARNENLKLFEKALETRSLDVARAKALGQILTLDAHKTLASLMIGDLVDETKFYQVLTPLLEKMHSKFTLVRAYGEMVDILLADNNLKAVIALESLWNKISSHYKFSLLCGYSKINLSEPSQEESLRQICSTHSHYYSNEGISVLTR